jgi:hypothetical protein
VNGFLFTWPVARVLFWVVLIAGCATPPAKDFKGPWQPINRFQAQSVKIPLRPTYVYYAAPIDDTLKTMLTRWAGDSGRSIDYGLDYDVTLYEPVAAIRTTDAQAAVSRLNDIYSAQAVRIVVSAQKITVRAASDAMPAASPLATIPSASGGVRFGGTRGMKP